MSKRVVENITYEKRLSREITEDDKDSNTLKLVTKVEPVECVEQLFQEVLQGGELICVRHQNNVMESETLVFDIPNMLDISSMVDTLNKLGVYSVEQLMVSESQPIHGPICLTFGQTKILDVGLFELGYWFTQIHQLSDKPTWLAFDPSGECHFILATSSRQLKRHKRRGCQVLILGYHESSFNLEDKAALWECGVCQKVVKYMMMNRKMNIEFGVYIYKYCAPELGGMKDCVITHVGGTKVMGVGKSMGGDWD